MPAKFFDITKKADKEISKLPLTIHRKINKAFDIIKENPLEGEKLHGVLKGYYKLRVGDYRIIYVFNAKQSHLTITKIEHRQGVYK